MRNFDIAALTQRQHLGADRAGGVEPGKRCDNNRHLIDCQRSPDRDRDDDQHQQPRHGQTDIGDATDHRVEEAAVISADKRKHCADADAEDAGDEADAQGQWRAGDHYREQVAALAVGAKRIVPGGRPQRGHRQRPGILDIHQQVADNDKQAECGEQRDANRQRRVAPEVTKYVVHQVRW